MSRIPDVFYNTPAHLQTDQLSDNFMASSHEILEITRAKEYVEFDKGLYSHMIVKPIKRIRASLGIDREMLVIISSFTDQQPRIVEITKRLLKSDSLRVESSLALIVHVDPEGDSKIRLWGREEGLSLIPIKLERGITSSRDLERIIASELYSFDPFDISGPVSDEGTFFGRKNEAIQVARQLRTGQIKSYLGIRKIGKTSLINRIVNDLKKDDNITVVMVDCSRDALANLTASELINSISETLVSSGGRNYIVPSLPKNRNPDISLAAESLSKSIAEHKKSVVIIFDEIDYITPSSPINGKWKREFNIFWRNVRAIYQDTKRNEKTLSLVISGVSGYWFRVESISDIENAALSFIPENYLQPLSIEAATSMIRELGLRCGLRFDEGAPEHIAGQSAYMPFWIRKSGSFIHKRLKIEPRPMSVSLEVVKEIYELFLEEEGLTTASVAIQHLFKIDVSTKQAAQKIYESKPLLRSDEIILNRYGIVSKNSSGYVLSGKMLEIAVESYFSRAIAESSTNSDTTKIDRSDFDEWAEDLAIVAKRANVIEAKLRGIVLNFLRMDSLIGTGKGSDDRVRACVESERREKLRTYSAESLMDKLYWIELKLVIAKEWPVFERIFNDKSKLESVMDVLNVRPHAHAKKLDRYRFAQYIAEIDWFEEKLSKL
jgi:ATPase domain predominantly from Archaea